MRRDEPASVYVIGAGNLIQKVGMSQNPVFRMDDFQKWSPVPLRLVCSLPVESRDEAKRVETHAHWLLRASRSHGEWFSCDARSAIEAVRGALTSVRSGTAVRERYSFQPPAGSKPEMVLAIANASDLSRPRLAEMCGVGLDTFYSWLKPATSREHREPPDSVIELLCSTFGLPMPPELG